MNIGALADGDGIKNFPAFLSTVAAEDDVVLLLADDKDKVAALVAAVRAVPGVAYRVFATEMTDWLEDTIVDADAVTISADPAKVLYESLREGDIAAISWDDDPDDALLMLLVTAWERDFQVFDVSTPEFLEVEFEDDEEEEALDFEERMVQRVLAEVMKRLEGDRRTRRPRR